MPCGITVCRRTEHNCSERRSTALVDAIVASGKRAFRGSTPPSPTLEKSL